jgi:hypothetical protein
MTQRAKAGKKIRAQRARPYPEGHRVRVEKYAATTLARWKAQGGPPMWFRLKTLVLAMRRNSPRVSGR